MYDGIAPAATLLTIAPLPAHSQPGVVLTTRILGMGRALGCRIVTNAEFESLVDTYDVWIATGEVRIFSTKPTVVPV
jgi:hypothetical protein